MSDRREVTIGLDCGATTSKVAAVDVRGQCLTQSLMQRPTRASDGPAAIVAGWIDLIEAYLETEALAWQDIGGMGLAIPGPYLGYGILGPMPNMPASLTGWHFLDDLREAVQARAGRPLRVVTANDGLLAGLAEARPLQARHAGSVLMFSPGSGLGCAFVDRDGRLLHGDHQAGVIFCHQPAPYGVLGLPAFSCGCGRNWGCHEAYTSLAGIPQYLKHFELQFPDHPIHRTGEVTRETALSLRGLAQRDDPLALAVFDAQAKALGLTVAAACMAYDPTHVVIGGGLIDPEATTDAFRTRYLSLIKESASTVLWVDPAQVFFHVAALGELSQAVGAALFAQMDLA